MIINLPKLSDARGNLTFIEGFNHIPFDIKRVYYLFDIPRGADRGAHGHRNLQQFIVAISGSFDVILDDGIGTKTFHMNRPDYGLFVSQSIWRDITNFSSGSVLMVLASEIYDESDYFRDYAEFINYVKKIA